MKKSGVETRAALSLIASCKYQLEEFEAAASYFTKLIQITQDNDDYKFSLAMCYYKSCDYSSAMKATYAVSSPAYEERILQLQSAIKYMEEDLPASKSLIEKQSQENEEAVINKGCILYKEGLYPEAIEKFNQAVQLGGSKSHLSFNIALCYYELKEYALSLKYIADIIERGIKEHPELSVGLTTEGIDVRSVGNTRVLHETALIEAFNLKAAIEYQLNNIEAAAEAMTDMPPRSEDELDSVTLHNSALVNMANAPTEGFEKLQYLLSTGSAPPVTFSNLIILYLKYEYFSLAADTMAENQELASKFMDPYLFNFVESLIMLDSSPEEAYRRLDVMASKHTELLRKLTKQVQEARNDQDEDKVKSYVNQYDEEIERFIPILMQQAKIYWDKENYNQVEKIFRKSVEFCNDHDVWKLNVAHVLFMQVPTEGENSAQSSHKFKEAAGFYEPIVKRNYESILNVEAVVLANLCVSYIMTSQNEEAEELMRRIEKEEETLGLTDFSVRIFSNKKILAYEYPERKVYHLCIVNLVIGTLYCSKGNFEFGITRVIKVIISNKMMILTPHFSLWNRFKRSSEWTLGFMSNDVSCLSWNLFQSISS